MPEPLPENWATLSPVQRAEWLADHAAAPTAAGPAPSTPSPTSTTAPKPAYVPYTPAAPKPTVNYAEQNAAQKAAQEQSTGNAYPADRLISAGGRGINPGLDGQPARIYMPDRTVYNLNPGTNQYVLSGYPISAKDLQQVAATSVPAARNTAAPTLLTLQPSSPATTGAGLSLPGPAPAPLANPQTLYTGGQNSQAISLPSTYQRGPSGFSQQNPLIPGQAGASFAPFEMGFAPRDNPEAAPTNIAMDGPQTAHLGSMSQGYNPATILADAHGGRDWTSGDAATDAVLAAQILQKQQAPGYGNGDQLAGLNNILSHGTFQSPLSGGLENVVRTDSGFAFSPGNVNSGNSRNSPMGAYSPITTPSGVVQQFAPDASEAAKAQAIGFTGQPTSNLGAVMDTARFNAANPGQLDQFASRANLPSPQELVAIAQAEKDREDAGAGGIYGDGPTRGFAKGGTFLTTSPTAFPMQGGGTAVTSEYGQPELIRQQGNRVNVTPIRGYASGGSFSLVPSIPGPDSGGEDSVTPVTPSPASAPGLNYTMGANPPVTPRAAALDTSPEVAIQAQLAAQQHARDNTAYQYREAGMGQPTGVVSGKNPGQLGLGQYWQPIDYTGQIQAAQSKLQGYGNTGDPNSLLTQLNAYKSQLDPLTQAQALQTKLQGYGQVGDPNDYLNQLNTIDQSLSRYNSAADIQTKLAGLGQSPDIAALLSQKAALNSQLDRYNQAQGISTKLAGLGALGDPSALGQQINSVQGQLAPLQAIQKNQLELQALGNLPDPSVSLANISSLEQQYAANQDLIKQAGLNLADPNAGAGGWTTAQLNDLSSQIQASIAQAKQDYSSAQNAAQRKQEILNLLGGNTADVSGQIGQLGAQLADLQRQQGNTQDTLALRSQYQNQLQSMGIDPNADLSGLIGGLQGQLSPLDQQIANAQSSGALRSQYQNQLSGLLPAGTDINSAMAGLQSQRATAQQGLSSAQEAGQLRSQITNLHPGSGDINAELAGLQSNIDQTQQGYGKAQDAQTLEEQIAALRSGQGGGIPTGGLSTSAPPVDTVYENPQLTRTLKTIASTDPQAATSLARIDYALNSNQWTPATSNLLAELAASITPSNRDTIQPALMQMVSRMKESRAVPPGLSEAAGSGNPSVIAAAAKFAA